MMMAYKEKDVTGPGDSDPQGPAGEGGTVPAPPPSSSDDGLPSVSRVGTGGARATTPNVLASVMEGQSRTLSEVAELRRAAEEWGESLVPPPGLLPLLEFLEEVSLTLKKVERRTQRDRVRLKRACKVLEKAAFEAVADPDTRALTPPEAHPSGACPVPTLCPRVDRSTSPIRTGVIEESDRRVQPTVPPPLALDEGTSAAAAQETAHPPPPAREKAPGPSSPRTLGLMIRVPGLGPVRIFRAKGGDVALDILSPPQEEGSGGVSNTSADAKTPPAPGIRPGKDGVRPPGSGSAVKPTVRPEGCFRCRAVDHTAHRCGGRDWEGLCYNCGSPSHLRRQCRVPGRPIPDRWSEGGDKPGIRAASPRGVEGGASPPGKKRGRRKGSPSEAEASRADGPGRAPGLDQEQGGKPPPHKADSQPRQRRRPPDVELAEELAIWRSLGYVVDENLLPCSHE
ncbi:uncharacterized protein LOC112638153 [Camponotus floridanus]|uniref:uncharacterized protein LOC112638153 n=1 Tax=Camponotus floridanus TaxID=104421 RepID=UPI000DC6A051|nr:uncharacterized protein LOC112638153 [Camponotus floridanus]